MREEGRETVDAEFLNARDAGKVIGVSAWVIRDLARRGKLPAYTIAGRNTLRFRREHLIALMTPTEQQARAANA